MMSLNTWLRNAEGRHRKWLGRLSRLKTVRRPVQPVRLHLEWLETRMLLSPPGTLSWPLPIPPFLLIDTWINPKGGNWDKPQNWSLGVPTPYDTVVIPYSGITIIHNWAVADSFQSLWLPASTTLLITAGSLTGNTFTNLGALILAGGNATFGLMTNAGSVDLQSGLLTASRLAQSGNFIIGPGGAANITALDNTGSMDVAGGYLSVDTLFQEAAFTIDSGGTADIFTSLNNTGTTDIQAGTLNAASATQAGNFTVESNGAANITTLDNTGSMDVAGGYLSVDTFTQESGFTIDSGGTANIATSLTNSGTVSVQNSTLTAGSYAQKAGATSLSNGILASPNAIQIQAGTLSGPGTINADLVNAGEISPGAPGTLAINGNYTQAATGILDIGLAGTIPGVEFDQVLISGTASLDGILNVNYLNNFAPSPGQNFQVMQFGSSSGAFAAIKGLNAANGTTLIAQYNPLNLTLVVQSIISINPSNPPPILSSPPPASPPANNTTPTGTTFIPPNSQGYLGFSTPNQTYSGSGGSQGYAPVGGFSELSAGKHSEDVAFSGGSGDDDQETMLDFPVQLNMTSDDEAFSTSDIAAALLVGVRPKLVPQKGSQVAPVATLLTDDSREEMSTITATDEENPLKDSLINPLGQMLIGSFQSSLRTRPGEDLAATGFDNPDGTPSPKSLFNVSPLAVLAGALVALWGIQKYRNAKVKPTQPGLET